MTAYTADDVQRAYLAFWEHSSSHDGITAALDAVAPAIAARALCEAADDLRSCVTCGKPHTPRDVTYPAADGTRYEGISWADPTDNHPLLTRATWLTWGDTPDLDAWLRARAEQVNP